MRRRSRGIADRKQDLLFLFITDSANRDLCALRQLQGQLAQKWEPALQQDFEDCHATGVNNEPMVMPGPGRGAGTRLNLRHRHRVDRQDAAQAPLQA